MERSEAAEEVGTIIFNGPCFGGEHTLRLLHRDGEAKLLLEVDGKAFRPLTRRGIRKILAERIDRVPSVGNGAMPNFQRLENKAGSLRAQPR